MDDPNSNQYSRALQSVAHLRENIPEYLSSPTIGIICGSGLGGLSHLIREDLPVSEVSYEQIPHFPESTVQGHAGKLLFGSMGRAQQTVVLMVGRLHFYEGHSMHDTTFPIRVLKLLGIHTLIVTNAAGGLNDSYDVGDIVILGDHLNLAGLAGIHPLRGPNADHFGERFTALSDAYSLDLRRTCHSTWAKIQKEGTMRRKLHEGVYAFVGGPSYETRAECRMLRAMGADLVGMSTVPEVIVARHCGMQVLAISLVTNKAVLSPGPRGNDTELVGSDAATLAASLSAGAANHAEVLEAGREAAHDLQLLVFRVVEGFR